ncbi:zinc finger protein 62 homolog isoform X2 [Anthonomus grandis grandis]|uniref:zinc finger protein 62 homolog isoform X2 n=1 Tax=Anthonomus grandis grandis TaxID=2921223 RepID=UPI0021669791|nr:zinc finger protein 62 homolog isoform X2 [Anthonomus grandis grandis]
MSGRLIDLKTLCRLCFSDKSADLRSAFAEDLRSACLPQKVSLLLQIQISRHDKLSHMVCNECIDRLDNWFVYKKQCHKNQVKLTEWLKISEADQGDLKDGLKFNETDYDPSSQGTGLLPVKVEITDDGEEFDVNVLNGLQTEANDNIFLQDLDFDLSIVETDDDRRCPDCGRMFGSGQNRRRHQNMLHAKKERRAKMAEIRKQKKNLPESNNKQEVNLSDDNSTKTDSQPENNVEDNSEIKSTEITSTSDSGVSKEQQNDDESTATETTIVDDKEKDDVNEAVSKNVPEDMEIDTLGSEKGQKIGEDKSIAEELDCATPISEEQEENNEVNPENQRTNEIKVEKQESNVGKTETKSTTSKNDEKKIEFAAGLHLVQKDTMGTAKPSQLSKIELSYAEKCKAMISMYQTLQCACHNVQHKQLKHLLQHLRDTRLWFPLFTCMNCMISLTDRSSFTRHHSKCLREPLEVLKKLSELKERTEIKTRLYQNFKCNRCQFLFSFHEDFCKHIDEDHVYGTAPFYCSCRCIFDSIEDYKMHSYTSCLISYYCDICFVTTSTIEEFIQHAQATHDDSEGFVLLQENAYICRAGMSRHKEADDPNNVVEGKRERKKSQKEPILIQVYDDQIPQNIKDIPNTVIKTMIQMEPEYADYDKWSPEVKRTRQCRCPVCRKQYSSIGNMIRHYRTHIERGEIEVPCMESEKEDLYTCPECGGVYPKSKWQEHLDEKHPNLQCQDCDKQFQFKTDLEQHRSVHLNLKVYRDSKTDSYKSAMLSPTAEELNPLMENGLMACEMCDAMFDNQEDLKEHKDTFHQVKLENPEEYMYENDASEMILPLMVNNEDSKSQSSMTDCMEKPFCDPCNKYFSSWKAVKDHSFHYHGKELSRKWEYPRKCDHCSKVCSTPNGFKLHMLMHDRNRKGEYPKQCIYCDKMCATGAGYFKHVQAHERIQVGDVKPKKEKKEEVLGEPPEEEEESYHTCKHCFKVFATKGRLKDHMKCHVGNKKTRKVLCDLCHTAFDSHEDLEEHKATEHANLDDMPMLDNEYEFEAKDLVKIEMTPDIIYACDICEAIFNTKHDLKDHKETHMPKNKPAGLTCKYCKITFTSVRDLTKHMHVEHGESSKPKHSKARSKYVVDEKPFKCPICKKAFASKQALVGHVGWHKRTKTQLKTELIENTPQATAEAKLYNREKALNKTATTRKQEPIEPPEFQCGTCLVELPNDIALQIHILEKHGNLDATMLIPKCHTCNKDFETQEEYDQHKRFHDFLERQKKHDKQQKIQTPVIQNIQSQGLGDGNLKKYPCNWCNSVFSKAETLNTHINSHHKDNNGGGEFKCQECSRVFDRQSSLNIHMQVHRKRKNAAALEVSPGGSKLYVCSLCNMGFNFPKDLRNHTFHAHPF